MGYETLLSAIGIASYHIRVILICALSTASDAIEIMAVSFVSSAAKQDLAMTDFDQGVLTSIIFLGMMFGAWIGGMMADHPRYGRKVVLFWALLCNGIFGLLSAFSIHFYMLLIIRFCSGIAVGCSLPVTFTYASEFLPKEKRGMYLAIMAISWPVGATLTSLVAFIIIPNVHTLHLQHVPFPLYSWRLFLMVCSIPAFVASIVFYLCADSSPKFLVYTRRDFEGARNILLKMYRSRIVHTNILQSALFESTSIQSWVQQPLAQRLQSESISALSCDEDNEADTNETALTVTEPNISCQKHSECKVSDSIMHKIWIKSKVLFDKEYRWPHILAATVWFTLSFGFYGLTEWLPTYFGTLAHVNEYKSTIATSVAQIPGAVLTCWFLEYCCDRKSTLSVSIALGTLTLIALPYLNNSSQIVIMSCAFNGVTVCGWTALDVISTELSPTHMRSTAYGFFTAMGRIGAIMGNITFGWFGADDIAGALLICGILLGIGTVACLFLPSTKGVAVR